MSKKTEVKIEMKVQKKCKSCIRYAAVEDDALITNVYLNNSYSDPMPETIMVTVAGQ